MPTGSPTVRLTTTAVRSTPRELHASHKTLMRVWSEPLNAFASPRLRLSCNRHAFVGRGRGMGRARLCTMVTIILLQFYSNDGQGGISGPTTVHGQTGVYLCSRPTRSGAASVLFATAALIWSKKAHVLTSCAPWYCVRNALPVGSRRLHPWCLQQLDRSQNIEHIEQIDLKQLE